ncbi:MAG: hypothetical protein LBQ62_02725 [Candidatus Accumulibacter sp.]|jgi:hypothetical protein|nr:hypothetical protein [Accumulibacter sp.]
MFPLFPFAAGLLVGAAAFKLIQGKKVKKELLDKAQERLRRASVSGLSTIEQSMAHLRSRIQASTPAASSLDGLADLGDGAGGGGVAAPSGNGSSLDGPADLGSDAGVAAAAPSGDDE